MPMYPLWHQVEGSALCLFLRDGAKSHTELQEAVSKLHRSWERGSRGPLRPNSGTHWAKETVWICPSINNLPLLSSHSKHHPPSTHTVVQSSFHTTKEKSCRAQGCGVDRTSKPKNLRWMDGKITFRFSKIDASLSKS